MLLYLTIYYKYVFVNYVSFGYAKSLKHISARRSADEQECQACQSVSSVIMMVLQYSKNPGGF